METLAAETGAILQVRLPTWRDELDQKQVRKAAVALLDWLHKKKAESNDLFSEDAETIFLFIRYKETPRAFCKFPIQLNLPHPYWSASDFKICLIVAGKKDGEKIARARQLLTPNTVAHVMTYSQLQTEYQDREDNARLCADYDLFLVDYGLTGVIQHSLGNKFVARKKMPAIVKLKKSVDTWAESIEAAKACAMMYCYVFDERSIRIGLSNFSADALCENFVSVLDQMTQRPEDGGWNNVLQLYMCTGNSPRLPVFQTLPEEPLIEVDEDGNEIVCPPKKRRKQEAVDPRMERIDAIVEEAMNYLP